MAHRKSKDKKVAVGNVKSISEEVHFAARDNYQCGLPQGSKILPG